MADRVDDPMCRPPPIDELVGFLHSRAADRLASLRLAFPELSDELRPGIIAGEAQGLLRARAEIAASAVTAMLLLAEPALKKVESKLRVVRTLRLVSQLCTALGSASGVGFTLGSLRNSAVISGIVAVIGSGAMIGIDHFGSFGSVKLFDHYAELREMRFEARRLEQELELRLKHMVTERDDAVVDQLIRDANDLAKKIDKTLAQEVA